MILTFSEVPVGARFEFRGRRYVKLALSLAADEERMGNVFQDQTEVLADIPHAARSAVRAPVRTARHWTEHLAVAPGQRAST